MELVEELGVPLAHEETEGPMSVSTFWGIELDTNHRTSRLPESKLKELRVWLAYFMGSNKATLHVIQQLVGHLSFACKAFVMPWEGYDSHITC